MLLRMQGSSKRAAPSLFRLVAPLLFTCFTLGFFVLLKEQPTTPSHLVVRYVEHGPNAGGHAYIPPSWLEQHGQRLEKDAPHGTSVLEKAEWASKVAIQQKAFVDKSDIPLIIHQIWLSNGYDGIVLAL